jgi:hypothetical protein
MCSHHRSSSRVGRPLQDLPLSSVQLTIQFLFNSQVALLATEVQCLPGPTPAICCWKNSVTVTYFGATEIPFKVVVPSLGLDRSGGSSSFSPERYHYFALPMIVKQHFLFGIMTVLQNIAVNFLAYWTEQPIKERWTMWEGSTLLNALAPWRVTTMVVCFQSKW